VGEIDNVAGRVAVLAVVENNTVAYKSASAWCVVNFLGFTSILARVRSPGVLAVPLPRAVARQTVVRAESIRGYLSVPAAGP